MQYIDEMQWDDKLTGIEMRSASPATDPINMLAWATVDRVFNYRQKIRDLVLKVIHDHIDFSDYDPKKAHLHQVWALLMGIEHENIHLETSCPIIRQLPLEMVNYVPSLKIAPYHFDKSIVINNVSDDYWVNHPGGTVTYRQQWSGSSWSLYNHVNASYYAWDNENGHRQATVQPFKSGKYLITNGEFLKFVESKEYKNGRYWPGDSNGWHEIHDMPRWWLRLDGDQWYLRLMDRVIPLPLNWPVEVNHHEAVAYINWVNEKKNTNFRLMTEDEFNILNNTTLTTVGEVNEKDPTKQVVGVDIESELAENSNLGLRQYHSSCPVGTFMHPSGASDLMGNVWNWTMTPFHPFNGFTVHKLYDDFSVPCFDGQHTIFKGGSWVTCGNSSLPWSRYAFRRHFYQFSGFRLTSGGKPPDITANPYEMDALVSNYIHFHFDDNSGKKMNIQNFPVAIALEVLKVLSKYGGNDFTGPSMKANKRALDLGCGPGRLTFELARHFKFAVGIDFSARFIQVAHQFRDSGQISYRLQEEGKIYSLHSITLDTKNLQNTMFLQGDAMNMMKTSIDADGNSLDLSNFDVIICANLIDRLRYPTLALNYLSGIQKAGQFLFITSPYTWMTEWTNENDWIGGKYVDGERLDTFTGLKKILEAHYELVSTCDIPFLLREHGMFSPFNLQSNLII